MKYGKPNFKTFRIKYQRIFFDFNVKKIILKFRKAQRSKESIITFLH